MTYLVTEDEKSQQSIEEKSVAHFSNSFKHYHNVHIHTHLKKKKKFFANITGGMAHAPISSEHRNCMRKNI